MNTPDVTLIAISVDPMSNGHYLTIIRYLDTKGVRKETNRVDLFLQGAEEFITKFRIQHHL